MGCRANGTRAKRQLQVERLLVDPLEEARPEHSVHLHGGVEDGGGHRVYLFTWFVPYPGVPGVLAVHTPSSGPPTRGLRAFFVDASHEARIEREERPLLPTPGNHCGLIMFGALD